MSETTYRVALVLPDRRHAAGGMRAPLASLTLALLKAQMPPTVRGCPVEVNVHDEQARGTYRVEDDRPDLLALTYLTTGAPRAYEISDEAMRLRSHHGEPIRVLHGGVHATSLPDEALQHCHMVVRGEAGPEFQHRVIERLADTDPACREAVRMREVPRTIVRPLPDWSWMDPKRYLVSSISQSSVGCPFGCSFCSVTEVFGAAMRAVNYGGFEAEVAALPKDPIVGLVDDNFLQGTADRHVRHCLTVADILGRHGHRWMTEVTVRTLIDAQKRLRQEGSRLDLIEYFAERGAIGFFFGIETVEEDGAGLTKSMDRRQVLDLIRHCHDCGLGVLGAFVLGVGPNEGPDSYKRVLEFAVEQARIEFLQCSINTPMPGSRSFLEAVRDGMILNYDWAVYDAEHCVVRHPRLSPEQLEEAHREVYRQFYRYGSIASRTLWPLLFQRPDPRAMRMSWRRLATAVPVNVALHGVNASWNDRLRGLPPRPVVPDLDPAVLAPVEEAIAVSPARPRDLFNVRRLDTGGGITVPL